jgi:hypothetical protein
MLFMHTVTLLKQKPTSLQLQAKVLIVAGLQSIPANCGDLATSWQAVSHQLHLNN